MHWAAPSEPTLGADGDPSHHPVATSGLLDTLVKVNDPALPELAGVDVVVTDLGVEHLTQRQSLAWPLLEAVQ